LVILLARFIAPKSARFTCKLSFDHEQPRLNKESWDTLEHKTLQCTHAKQIQQGNTLIKAFLQRDKCGTPWRQVCLTPALENDKPGEERLFQRPSQRSSYAEAHLLTA
jgi:hypothetical protein